MPLIFSYGSLQEERVQLSTFGRLLDGWKDEALGFDVTSATVDDPAAVALSGKHQHANLVRAGHDRRVAGTVFEISDEELCSVDEYEAVFSYKRIEAALASGKKAWVYVHAPDGIRPHA